MAISTAEKASVDGKFLRTTSGRFLVRGVTYGTFAPDTDGRQFPAIDRVAADFAMMSRAGINTVRTYTSPDEPLLDEAARHGLHTMAGLPWTQHVAFLNDRRLIKEIRRSIMTQVQRLAHHPAILLFALGNEIPAGVVRWLGPRRVERFLRDLYDEAKAIAPDSLFTYVNYPPTEYLSLPFVDVVAFNVYLHDETDLKDYIARLHNVAGHRPLLLAEAGADSIREGAEGQAMLTAMQLRAAFAEGAAGAIAFAWTDEWWRGGSEVNDWAFGLVDRERRPKAALSAAADVFAQAPFSEAERVDWPTVSVVVCAYNASSTIGECLDSLERLTYPRYEIIVVDDGSQDSTADVVCAHEHVKLIRVPNGGLSVARNLGLGQATGEIVAYVDADVRVDQDWLTFLIRPFLESDVVAVGGPNVVPPDDSWVAQCVACAPGGPIHVLLDDRIAEHVPGCNLAVRREALLAIGGFNPIYLRAGDDVDVCWRLQAHGWQLGFAPAALVWHRHRDSVKAFWRQQVGYGEGQAWLIPHHPEKFVGRKIRWRGCIYSALPFVRSQSQRRVNTGVWGTAAFPSVYRQKHPYPLAFLPHSVRWQVCAAALIASGAIAAFFGETTTARALVAAGVSGIADTIALCIQCALASDIAAVPPLAGRSRVFSRVVQRALIAWLHMLQPFARATGEIRGWLSPPPVTSDAGAHRQSQLRHRVADWWAATCLWAGRVDESLLWSERWVSADGLLTSIIERLRRARFAHIEFDEGWQHHFDISVGVGRSVWLDLRLLVEEHEGGKCLVRIARRLRPRRMVIVAGTLLAIWILLPYFASGLVNANSFGRVGWLVGVTLIATGVWRTQRTIGMVERAVSESVEELHLLPLEVRSMARIPVTRTTSVVDVMYDPPVWHVKTTPVPRSPKLDKLPTPNAMLTAPSPRGRRQGNVTSRSSASIRR
jgi:GT2 family glycosyltransferase